MSAERVGGVAADEGVVVLEGVEQDLPLVGGDLRELGEDAGGVGADEAVAVLDCGGDLLGVGGVQAEEDPEGVDLLGRRAAGQEAAAKADRVGADAVGELIGREHAGGDVGVGEDLDELFDDGGGEVGELGGRGFVGDRGAGHGRLGEEGRDDPPDAAAVRSRPGWVSGTS